MLGYAAPMPFWRRSWVCCWKPLWRVDKLIVKCWVLGHYLLRNKNTLAAMVWKITSAIHSYWHRALLPALFLISKEQVLEQLRQKLLPISLCRLRSGSLRRNWNRIHNRRENIVKITCNPLKLRTLDSLIYSWSDWANFSQYSCFKMKNMNFLKSRDWSTELIYGPLGTTQ